MVKLNFEVMPSLKGSNVNVVPSKENYNPDIVYRYNDRELVEKVFGLFEDNRSLNKKHIKEIKEDIKSDPYHSKYFAPIRVDINTMKVADGQHRLKAFLEAWSEGSVEEMRVIFEDFPAEEVERMDVISTINGTNKNWTINNHQERLLKEGNIHMLNIADFGKAHRLCQKLNKKGEVVGFYPRYVSAYLFGKNTTNEVKDNTIQVSDEDLTFGEQIYSEVERLFDVLPFEKGAWFESFIYSWYWIRKADRVYSKMILKIGMDKICEMLPEYANENNWQVVTRKSKWDNWFRDFISYMDELS